MSKRISVLTAFAITLQAVLSPTAAQQKSEFLPKEFTRENITACFQALAKKPDYTTDDLGGSDVKKFNGLRCSHSHNNTQCNVRTLATDSSNSILATLNWAEGVSFDRHGDDYYVE